MPLQFSPLYGKATAAAKKAALQMFAGTEFGKLYSQSQRHLRQSGQLTEKFARMAKRTVKPTPREVLKEITGCDLPGLIREIRRYAKGPELSASLVGEFLDALGPAGKLLKILASAGPAAQPDLEAMAEVLRASGYTVVAPEEAPGAAAGGVPRGATGQASERARQAAERGAAREAARAQRPATRVSLTMTTGRKETFAANHPIVTGEMVKADSSTNVHSFAYRYDSATLYVRFWSGKGRGRYAGPMYAYYQVEPEQFLDLYRVRAKGNKHLPGTKSPGTFVWDRLRIPGTMSGHQYDYRLVGVARGYVPRKATVGPEGEEYRRRKFRTASGKWLYSELPNAFVRPLFRGEPNRGTPNRGTP